MNNPIIRRQLPTRRVPKHFLLPLCAYALIFSCRSEEPAAKDAKPVILLTGFEPFGKSDFNTSWNVVSKFEGKEIGGYTLKTLQLKVVYDAVEKPLQEAIEKLKPAAVISFGEGSAGLRFELLARNGYHWQKPKDNLGNRPPREKILPQGNGTIRSGLPVVELFNKLNEAGIDCEVSMDAGGYLCNECFYRLMAVSGAPAMRGFVHVPVIQPDNEAEMHKLGKSVELVLNVVAARVPKK